MGLVIDPHEVYFSTFFDRFNMRLGPPMMDTRSVWHSGGIAEITALQREFEIFREGRPFLESAALLGLGGTVGGPAKDRWLEYLTKLPQMRSDMPDLTGDQRIVAALIQNLKRRSPLPCHMEAYDGRTREPGLVLVTEGNPTFFLESVKFLTISLPMRPTPPPTRSAATGPRSRTGSGASRGRKKKAA